MDTLIGSVIVGLFIVVLIVCIVGFFRSVLREINKYKAAPRPRDEALKASVRELKASVRDDEIEALKERVQTLEAKCHHCGH